MNPSSSIRPLHNPNPSANLEELSFLPGPSCFAWDGNVYSLADLGLADASLLWLWSDGGLPDSH